MSAERRVFDKEFKLMSVELSKNFPAEDVFKIKPQGLNPTEWSLFKTNTKIDKLFVEYVVHG